MGLLYRRPFIVIKMQLYVYVYAVDMSFWLSSSELCVLFYTILSNIKFSAKLQWPPASHRWQIHREGIVAQQTPDSAPSATHNTLEWDLLIRTNRSEQIGSPWMPPEHFITLMHTHGGPILLTVHFVTPFSSSSLCQKSVGIVIVIRSMAGKKKTHRLYYTLQHWKFNLIEMFQTKQYVILLLANFCRRHVYT